MVLQRAMQGSNSGSFKILSEKEAIKLPRDSSERFCFRVLSHWQSPVSQNPFAIEAKQHVLAWFESLGCTPKQLERARKFDIAGYVGMAFPNIPRDETVRMAQYLSNWLLWDDELVEQLKDRWRIKASDVLSGRRPKGMNHFDEGWWQLLMQFAARRSHVWIRDVCDGMFTWNAIAIDEGVAKSAYNKKGVLPSFERQVDMRIATIGMYVTTSLLEDALNFELPREFHADPQAIEIKRLSNLLVGLGNDVFSLGKDESERQINLVTTLMQERGLSIEHALESLIRMHDKAIEDFDLLAESVSSRYPEAIQWIQGLRYASLGFSLWESQAPRYICHKLVVDGRVIEPRFSFLPDRSAP